MMGPISRKAGYAIKPLTRPTVVAYIENEADYEQATALLNILLDAVRDDASRPGTAPSIGAGLRSIPTGLIPHRSPIRSGSAAEPTIAFGPR